MTKRTIISTRTVVSLGLVALAACGETKPPPLDSVALAQYTVSYRSRIRVPAAGVRMKHAAFAEQVERQDPIEAIRCPVSNDEGFQKAVDALGGITWTHPVAVLKDLSKPPLYRGRIPSYRLAAPTAEAGASDKSAGPTIERPDLVGYQENTAIFLSQRHGLLAVRTDTAKPEVSCSLKLPGEPKYFFYKGDELVLLVNGTGVTQAAMLRFRVKQPGFEFIDSVMLADQQIQDARLFDRTLVVYANMFAPIPSESAAVAAQAINGASSGGGVSGSSGGAAPSGDRVYSPSYFNPSRGVKLTTVKWDGAFKVDWQEEFLNDPVPAQGQSASLQGVDPSRAPEKLNVGDVVSSYKNYKNFISASDRYLVVSRDISRTVFTGTEHRTYSYTNCTASHESEPRKVTYCSPTYEQRKNPDYRDPKTTKGDYACNGKKLEDCIAVAAPQVSRYIYVRTGQSCQTNTYRDWICDKYETITNSYSYPTYRTDASTQFVVYRYAGGDFVKLDEQLYQMEDPGAGANDVESLSFTGKPLELPGSVDHKGDLQFQHGHFYVLTHQGETLHTMLLTGNSIAYLSTQSNPRRNSGRGYSYSGAHSTLFSDDRMMVSRAYFDYYNSRGIQTWSDVIMLDLSMPSFPKMANQFAMPGSSDQLILANTGVLGPGSVSFSSGGVGRNLQKITLFNKSDANEIDNVLLGTEFNADMVQSWLGVNDDQRIRFDGESSRLFLPYSGFHHVPAEVFNPAAHRLNITHVGGSSLMSEITFDLAEDIIRTVSLDSRPTSGRALAFGDSSVYTVNQGGESWSLDVVQEFATPIAVYRLNDDGDIHARVDRIGTRCQISTFAGSARAFRKQHLANGPKVDCLEWSQPMGIASSVVFADSKTGWNISEDGLSITAVKPAEVTKLMALIQHDDYCALDTSKEDGTPVEFLDDVPSSIVCLPYATGKGGSGIEFSSPGGVAK